MLPPAPPPHPAVAIRPTTESDWESLRDLRLAMVAETPLSYLETLEDARRTPEAQWRKRAARGSSPRSVTLAAVTPDGRLVGSMTAFRQRGGVTALAAIYVAPEYRGRDRGVTDALLAGVERWATAHSTTLTLDVNDSNVRARAAYASRGFLPTGASHPHPLDPSTLELELAKPLVRPLRARHISHPRLAALIRYRRSAGDWVPTAAQRAARPAA